MTDVYRGKVVTENEVIDEGIVVVDNGIITYAGAAKNYIAPGGDSALCAHSRLPQNDVASADCCSQNDGKIGRGFETASSDASGADGYYILPGLVDIHNHGGGGASFPDATDAETVRQGVNEHLMRGTTTMLASTVTASREVLLARAELLGELTREGVIAGMHSEGPFLSFTHRGAQSPDFLIPGDPQLVRDMQAAAQGALKTMTVAPEIPGVAGAGGAAEALIEVGAIPSLGHTSSTQAQSQALIDQVTGQLAGTGKMMTITHMYNGMPPLHHRAPGPLAACIPAAAEGKVIAELICDGVHIDPGLIRSMQTIIGSHHIAFVTDAMAAAGMPDGSYQLGPMAVVVGGGVARLENLEHPDEPGAIAGGTSHLIDQVRIAVSAGVPLVDAVRSASATPARALGFTDVGSLAVGKRANILVTDTDFKPLQIIKDGKSLL